MCVANDCAVFLDLRTDSYISLTRDDTAILLKTVMTSSSEGICEDSENSLLRPNDAQIFDSLISRGLLTTDRSLGKRISVPAIPTPAESLTVDYVHTRWKGSDFVRFVAASALASALLRWISIEDIVKRVERKRAAAVRTCNDIDENKLKQLVAIFMVLRPFYARQYRCLFDSLALINFLSFYNVMPAWIYGVQTEPFFAHCWLQQGSLVLNDTIERVRHYSPIMSV